MAHTHFIAMAGLHGCIPIYCDVFPNYASAVESLAQIHELGKNRTRELRRNGYLELNLGRDGNEYAEISECSCDNPQEHSEDTIDLSEFGIDKYTYHIDLDERGLFMAHVDNPQGKTIIRYDLPQWECMTCGNGADSCTCENMQENLQPDWDIFDWDTMGIVKNFEDVEGLERHYKECGIMPENARLVME